MTAPILASILVLALAACGGPRAEAPSRTAVETPRFAATVSRARFADADPFAWTDAGPQAHAVHGIDVSRWQGTIDWQRVRAWAIAFAYIKATEGGDVVDPRFAANWRGAAAAGLPRGAYHFYYFCRSAAEQAAWFAANVPRERGALPPVLDVEWNHASRTCRRRPAPAEIHAELRTYLAAMVRQYGRRPLVYTTVDFYRDNGLGTLPGVDFWLRSTAAHPSVTYPGQDWIFWQHTGTGLVDGIAGPTDINAFAGTEADWRRWAAR